MSKSMNKAYEFGKHKGVGVYWNKDTDTVELPEAVFRYILSLVPTEQDRPIGHWINNQNGTYTCDKCAMKHSRSNYCANCGAEME